MWRRYQSARTDQDDGTTCSRLPGSEKGLSDELECGLWACVTAVVGGRGLDVVDRKGPKAGLHRGAFRCRFRRFCAMTRSRRRQRRQRPASSPLRGGLLVAGGGRGLVGSPLLRRLSRYLRVAKRQVAESGVRVARVAPLGVGVPALWARWCSLPAPPQERPVPRREPVRAKDLKWAAAEGDSEEPQRRAAS